ALGGRVPQAPARQEPLVGLPLVRAAAHGLGILANARIAALVVRVIRGALALPFFGASQRLGARHAGISAGAQGEQQANNAADHQHRDQDRLHRSNMRSKPSCAVLATRRPSRVNTLPRARPRAPEALGLSVAYSSHSSSRALR